MRLLKEENGFWSAYVLIFVVTLALMGMGAAMLMRNEGVSIAKTAERVQADYAAESGVFFGIKAIEKGVLTTDNNEMNISVGNASVYINLESDGGNQQLSVTSDYGNSSSTVVVDVQSGTIADRVIIAKSSISGIKAYNESGIEDNNLLLQNTDIPTIDVAALYALSSPSGQNHDQPVANWSPLNNYLGSFFVPGTGQPNVTHVYGNLNVGTNIQIWGIFVVDGSVTLNPGSNVQGVIYVVNSSNTYMDRIWYGATIRVNGGVVTNGDVSASWLGNVKVQHNPTFMQAFAAFQTGSGGNEVTVSNWTYQ